MNLRMDSHNSIKKTIMKLIIILAGVFFWISAIYNQSWIADSRGTLSVRYPDSVISMKELEYALEGMKSRKDSDIPEVTLWQRDEKTMIRKEDVDKTLTVDLVTVAGDMSKLYPGTLLYGGYLSREDHEGCVIDRNSAHNLFGSEKVIGLKIMYMDREYSIRGVMKSANNNTMIIHEDTQGIKEEYKMYNSMELDFSEQKNALTLAKNFVHTYGLGEPSAYINYDLPKKLAEFLIHIPVWLGAVWVIVLLTRKVNSLKSSLLLSLMGYSIVIVFIIVLIKLSDIRSAPSSMIPSKWSDFDFWVDKWKEMIGFLRGRDGMIYYFKDYVLRNRLFYVIVGVVLTILIEIIVIIDFHNKSVRYGFMKEDVK